MRLPHAAVAAAAARTELRVIFLLGSCSHVGHSAWRVFVAIFRPGAHHWRAHSAAPPPRAGGSEQHRAAVSLARVRLGIELHAGSVSFVGATDADASARVCQCTFASRSILPPELVTDAAAAAGRWTQRRSDLGGATRARHRTSTGAGARLQATTPACRCEQPAAIRAVTAAPVDASLERSLGHSQHRLPPPASLGARGLVLVADVSCSSLSSISLADAPASLQSRAGLSIHAAACATSVAAGHLGLVGRWGAHRFLCHATSISIHGYISAGMRLSLQLSDDAYLAWLRRHGVRMRRTAFCGRHGWIRFSSRCVVVFSDCAPLAFRTRARHPCPRSRPHFPDAFLAPCIFERQWCRWRASVA